LIEILASTVVIWQLTDTGGTRERVAMRIIGGAFIALAIYIATQGVYLLVSGGRPAPSPLGIAWTAATCALMLCLALGRARTGAALFNKSQPQVGMRPFGTIGFRKPICPFGPPHELWACRGQRGTLNIETVKRETLDAGRKCCTRRVEADRRAAAWGARSTRRSR
jgi:hypothetical protein